MVKIGLSATASFDSFLGSFILSAQCAPMFSTSPLTYLVPTLAITYLLISAGQFLSESKSHFHSILEMNPKRCLKGMSRNTCSNTSLQYKTCLISYTDLFKCWKPPASQSTQFCSPNQKINKVTTCIHAHTHI